MEKEKGIAIMALLAAAALSGCAGINLAPDDAQREFTFDYEVQERTQGELWKAARDHFAGAYGDSRSVFRVMDEDDGIIIGKGIASWQLVGGTRCLTDYHIRFAAKDQRARLQFELVWGVPVGSPCSGWPRPSEEGYREIVNNFRTASGGLESALRGGGASERFRDF